MPITHLQSYSWPAVASGGKTSGGREGDSPRAAQGGDVQPGGVVCPSFCLALVPWPGLEEALAKLEGLNPRRL